MNNTLLFWFMLFSHHISVATSHNMKCLRFYWPALVSKFCLRVDFCCFHVFTCNPLWSFWSCWCLFDTLILRMFKNLRIFKLKYSFYINNFFFFKILHKDSCVNRKMLLGSFFWDQICRGVALTQKCWPPPNLMCFFFGLIHFFNFFRHSFRLPLWFQLWTKIPPRPEHSC